METIILKTIRSVVVFCAALFALAARAADYYWTGHAGNNLWHDRNNWSTVRCSDAEEVNVPSSDLSDQTTAKTYVFALTADTVITADVNVVAGWLYCGSSPASPITIKIVSEEGKKFRFAQNISSGQRAITTASKNVTFELNVDMSSDTDADGKAITVQGNVIFNLTAANKGSRPISINSGYKVSIADGSVPPVFSAMSEPSASTIDLGDSGVTVGTASASSATNDFSGLVVANGGTLSFKNERAASLRGLPVGGTLAVDRSEALVSPGIITRLMFDDASDPLKDGVGQGSRLVATNGVPEIFTDAERGRVASFDGTKSLKGPDDSDGVYGFLPESGYTVAMWIKPEASADTKTLINFGTAGTAYKEVLLRLYMRKGMNLFPSLYQGSASIFSNSDASNNAADGNWHHVAVTFDGDKTISLYYDGTFIENLTTSASNKPDNKNFAIGGWSGTGGGSYIGLMDDVLVMNGAMSAEQIASLYSSGLAATVPAGAVKADGSGTVEFSAAAAGAASISGNALGGGIRLADGATFRVGADAGSTSSVFKGGISGGGATLVKDGAAYSLTLAGQAAAVTNLVVSQGVLALSRPVVRQGAVLYYTFDDETNIGADSGLNGVTLTETGSGAAPSSAASGVRGKALHLDGGQYLTTAATLPSAFPQGETSWTVSSWIKPDSSIVSDSSARVFQWSVGSDTSGTSATAAKLAMVRMDANKLLFGHGVNASSNLSTAQTDFLADGNWHHVVAVYDAATDKMRLYLDGTETTKSVNLYYPMPNAFTIGSGYKGDIDEVAVCNYAMTAGEVAAEYSRAVAAPVSAETAIVAPVAHWAFDGDASESVGNIELSATGTVTYETGDHICGQAARFDGSQSFSADTFPSAIPTGTSDWTAIARFKPDTDPGDNTLINWGGADWKTCVLIKEADGYSFRANVKGRQFTTLPGVYTTAMGTDATRWVTVAITHHSNEVNLYVDGELHASGSGSTSLGNTTFEISRGFKGLIDDIRIYDKALTAAEVRTIADVLEAGCTGASPTSVLTASPDVAIASGATLKIASVENVNALSGAGTVEVAPNARLTVGDLSGFSGGLSGAGQIGIASGATLAFGDGSSPILATSGTLALGANVSVTTSFTAPGSYVVATAAGFSGVDNLSTWTAPNLGSRKYRFILSSDGQLILRISAGLIVFVQ